MAFPNYKSRLKAGSLKQTTKRMMVSKIGSSKPTPQGFKKFLKEDEALRRLAYSGDATTVEAWKGKNFLREAKEHVKESSAYRESLYGKKTTVGKAFRDTVHEEVREEQEVAQQHAPATDKDRDKKIAAAKERIQKLTQDQGSGRLVVPPAGGSGTGESGTVSSSSRPVPMAIGGSGAARVTKDPSTISSAVPVFGGTASDQKTVVSWPPVFGLRGRILRIDEQEQSLSIRVLNAPTELGVLIGHDRILRLTEDTRYWKDRHRAAFGDLRISDHIDVRGKVLNNEFCAEEVHANDAELPEYVIRLERAKADSDTQPEPPIDLAIG